MDQYEQYYVPPPAPAPSDSPDGDELMRSLQLVDWNLGKRIRDDIFGASDGGARFEGDFIVSQARAARETKALFQS